MRFFIIQFVYKLHSVYEKAKTTNGEQSQNPHKEYTTKNKANGDTSELGAGDQEE